MILAQILSLSFIERYEVLYAIESVEAYSHRLYIFGMRGKFKKLGVYVFLPSGTFKKIIDRESKSIPRPEDLKKRKLYKGPIFDDITIAGKFLYGVFQPHAIYQFTLDGKFIRMFSGPAGPDWEPGKLCSLFMARIRIDGNRENGDLYVLDHRRVQVFTPDGELDDVWYGGTGEGRLERPRDIAVDGKRGVVYITDEGVIKKYTLFGNYIGKIEPRIKEKGKWKEAKADIIEVDDKTGLIYVGRSTRSSEGIPMHDLHIFTSDGKWLGGIWWWELLKQRVGVWDIGVDGNWLYLAGGAGVVGVYRVKLKGGK